MKVENITCRKVRLRWFELVKILNRDYIGNKHWRWYHLGEEEEEEEDQSGEDGQTET